MSSSTTAFACAFFLSLESIAQAIHNHNVHAHDLDRADASDDKISILQSKISECRNVEQVIDTVYPDYCPAFKEFLLTYASWCEKWEAVKSSLERLTCSLEAQTVPPHLRVKAPEFQFTKEFGDSNSDAASVACEAFSVATATFQEAINATSLAGKKAELRFWEEKLELSNLVEKLADIIATVWNDRRTSRPLHNPTTC